MTAVDVSLEQESTNSVAAWLAAVPAGDWSRCPNCRAVAHQRRIEEHLHTCPVCTHHFRMGAEQRIELLVDPDSFTELDAGMSAEDPLGFSDQLPYRQRLTQARERSGQPEAARYGRASIGANPVVICAMDFAFQGGSMGAVVGEKVTRAAELALAHRTPLIVCATSGGARMQEGIFSLLQMAKTAAALQRLREAGVPYISVLADPVYGGVSASFATLGDVVIAEPQARVGFAGPRVIEQTIRQQLPAGFQTAEFLLEKGHIDAVVARTELRAYLTRLLLVHARAETPVEPDEPALVAAGSAPIPQPESVWPTVQLARHPDRPNLGEYLQLICEQFVELRGDRWDSDDQAITGGPALLDGRAVMVIGHRKGRGTAENVSRNFGMPHPAGYRKAARLMRYAERFGLSVITVIDTPGAYPGLRAEENNQSLAIAEDIALLSSLRVPVLSLVIGEGGSGGALALGVCDRLLMLENTMYSVISPEGCAAILFGDAGRAPEAAEALRCSAAELYRLGIVEEIVPEPAGGAHRDPVATATAIGLAVSRHLNELAKLSAEELVERRYARLREYGPFRTEGEIVHD